MSFIRQREQESLQMIMKEIQKAVAVTMEELGLVHWPGQHGKGVERYLIWLQWSRRYNLPFEKVVKLVVTECRRWLRKTDNNLGISLTLLTSSKVEEWLRTQVTESTSTAPKLKLPARYNNLDDYAERMAKLRRNQKMQVTKPYRGSVGWKRPQPDPIRIYATEQ